MFYYDYTLRNSGIYKVGTFSWKELSVCIGYATIRHKGLAVLYI